MVELQEREVLLASLKGYLEELKESGVEELSFGTGPLSAATAPSPLAAPVADISAGPTGPTGPTGPSAPAISAVGDPQATLMLVAAGGGFEGASGALLAKIVVAMGFAPEQVLLATLDRDLSPSDAALRKAVISKIAEVTPKAVVALGEKAAQLILESAAPISRLRGRFVKVEGVSVMATLHPDQLLADETLKREVWNEMKKVMAHLNRTASPS